MTQTNFAVRFPSGTSFMFSSKNAVRSPSDDLWPYRAEYTPGAPSSASTQVFYPRVQGNAPCFGHVSCDAIIMGTAKVRAIPEISCNHVDAGLIHEAAIGRIAGEQLLKLETLGLTPEEAEEKILEGFLR